MLKPSSKPAWPVKACDVTPDEDDKKLAPFAKKAHDEGGNPASWVGDEDMWEKAKEAARESYDESDDAFWAVVTSIYKKMGGVVKSMEVKPDDAVKASLQEAEEQTEKEEKRPFRGNQHVESSQRAYRLSDEAAKASRKALTSHLAEDFQAAADSHCSAKECHEKEAGMAEKRGDKETAERHKSQAEEHGRGKDMHEKLAGYFKGKTAAVESKATTSGYASIKDIIHCASSTATFDVDPPAEFMWMPGGTTTINAAWNGRPIELTVQCDQHTAAAVQASLDEWKSKYPMQKPFGCIEHKEEDAALWPLGFNWKSEPKGVFCTTEWSALGDQHIRGKIHRSFSPSFTTDAEYSKAKPAQASDPRSPMVFPEGARGSRSNPAKVTGVSFSIGSLTNKPAFKNIVPVRAKEEPAPEVAPLDSAFSKLSAVEPVLAKLSKARTEPVVTAATLVESALQKLAVKAGDRPGHEFHGNQYTEGGPRFAEISGAKHIKTEPLVGGWRTSNSDIQHVYESEDPQKSADALSEHLYRNDPNYAKGMSGNKGQFHLGGGTMHGAHIVSQNFEGSGTIEHHFYPKKKQ